MELFAGIRVADLAAAQDWYERLLGKPPTFFPNATEAVWQLAEHRHLYIEQVDGAAGGGLVTLFLDRDPDGDLDALVADIAARGIEPVARETYSNGVQKATYRDPDGNEIGFGGGGVEAGD